MIAFTHAFHAPLAAIFGGYLLDLRVGGDRQSRWSGTESERMQQQRRIPLYAWAREREGSQRFWLCARDEGEGIPGGGWE